MNRRSETTTKVFVGTLPAAVTAEDLRRLFAPYGAIAECDIANRCGFLHLEDRQLAARAIAELNGANFMGVRISVEKGRVKPGRGSSGGGPMRSSGRNNNRPAPYFRGGGVPRNNRPPPLQNRNGPPMGGGGSGVSRPPPLRNNNDSFNRRPPPFDNINRYGCGGGGDNGPVISSGGGGFLGPATTDRRNVGPPLGYAADYERRSYSSMENNNNRGRNNFESMSRAPPPTRQFTSGGGGGSLSGLRSGGGLQDQLFSRRDSGMKSFSGVSVSASANGYSTGGGGNSSNNSRYSAGVGPTANVGYTTGPPMLLPSMGGGLNKGYSSGGGDMATGGDYHTGYQRSEPPRTGYESSYAPMMMNQRGYASGGGPGPRRDMAPARRY